MIKIVMKRMIDVKRRIDAILSSLISFIKMNKDIGRAIINTQNYLFV